MRWALLLLIATGCRQLLGFERPLEGDAAIGDADGMACVGSPDGLFGRTCFVPEGAISIGGNLVIDTDEDPLCRPDARACVVEASVITITARVDVRGSRPLVLASATRILIGETGTIDASSLRNLKTGPNANSTACASVDGATLLATDPAVGGGGAGGAYGSSGGPGGLGRSGGLPTDSLDGPSPDPIGLRGGCRGGDGGLAPDSGGDSGGALYLMAGEEIVVRGLIHASGAGGGGGAIAMLGGGGVVLSGGGGGGSGGLIGFEAPQVTFEGATLVALGGGGGSGAGTEPGEAGGSPSVGPSIGVGALATVSNNSGGSGGSLDGAPGNTGGDVGVGLTGGGGGGGGGAGYIVVVSETVLSVETVAAPPISDR